MKDADFRFTHTFQTRLAEADAHAFIFDYTYLIYFDEAITAYFQNLPYPLPRTSPQIPFFRTRHAGLTVNHALQGNQTVTACVRADRLRRTDIQFSLELYPQEAAEAAVTGQIEWAYWSASGTEAEIPEGLRARLLAFEPNLISG